MSSNKRSQRMVTVILVCVFQLAGTTSFSQKVSYEAARWKTKMVDNAANLSIISPPNKKQTETELRHLRKAAAGVDSNKMKEIIYWNAGAPAYRWNQIAPKFIRMDRPDILFRFPTAWMNLAIYDATILAWREKVKHKKKRPNEADPSINTAIETPGTFSYPCEHSVTAAAAGYVLAYFFPELKDSILNLARSASESRVLAGVQYPSDVAAGWQLGEQVAKRIIEKAKQDGSTLAWKGEANNDPTKWTGPYALGIDVQLYSPVFIRSGNQFRPPPPPDFKMDMEELKNFKQSFRSSAMAYFWATNGDLDYWNQQANRKMFDYGLLNDAPAVARVYTMLHGAFHDATIASFDAKYAYWGIRPDQYDTTYTPLIPTPPFPGYPAGHAIGAATSSAILSHFFPADAKEFEKLAKDCAESRFYAGVHFRSDNTAGTTIGYQLGRYIVENWNK